MNLPTPGTDVAVITGAAGGIGRAIALELATRGYQVVIGGLEGDDLRATAQLIAQGGGHCIHQVADVTDAAALRLLASRTAELGGAVVLVNNAAIYPAHPWTEISEDEWDRVLAVNLKGAFLSCRAFYEQLDRRGGSIVNVASNTFFRGWPGLLHYVSSKGALVGLTRSLAREVGEHGIRVNAVAPGAIPTRGEEINPNPEAFSRWVLDNQSLKRRGTPQDVAAAVAFLASRESDFITGQTLLVDGGWLMH